MYELTLSPQEIQDFTRYKLYTQQQHQLRCHGIPFTRGPKNEPIVLRRHLQEIRDPLQMLSEYVSDEPDFGAIENGKTAFK